MSQNLLTVFDHELDQFTNLQKETWKNVSSNDNLSLFQSRDECYYPSTVSAGQTVELFQEKFVELI